FAEVEARLGGHDELLDAFALAGGEPVDDRLGGVHREGDRIFERQGHGLLAHQKILQALNVESACRGELVDVDEGAPGVDAEVLDSRPHARLSATAVLIPPMLKELES